MIQPHMSLVQFRAHKADLRRCRWWRSRVLGRVHTLVQARQARSLTFPSPTHDLLAGDRARISMQAGSVMSTRHSYTLRRKSLGAGGVAQQQCSGLEIVV